MVKVVSSGQESGGKVQEKKEGAPFNFEAESYGKARRERCILGGHEEHSSEHACIMHNGIQKSGVTMSCYLSF